VSIFLNDEVPDVFARHSVHDRFDIVVRIAKDRRSHDISNKHVAHRT
jgi:hypothetical protein